MKLWEIKAQALRIMFSDTSLNFSQTDFESGIILANSNTREKYIRMNDSINRAIDSYFAYCGGILQTTTKTLKYDEITETYSNVLETAKRFPNIIKIAKYRHMVRKFINSNMLSHLKRVNIN